MPTGVAESPEAVSSRVTAEMNSMLLHKFIGAEVDLALSQMVFLPASTKSIGLQWVTK